MAKENVFKRFANWLNGPEDENPEVADMEGEFTGPLDQEDSERENVEDAEYEKVEKTKKTKVEGLREKLDTLLKQLEGKKLSPFQRLVLKAKLDIIQSALEREEAKKSYRNAKEEYEKYANGAIARETEWEEQNRRKLNDEYMEKIHGLVHQIKALENEAEQIRDVRSATNQIGEDLGLLGPGEEYIPKGEVGLTTAIANINEKIQTLREEQSKTENEIREKQKSAFEEHKKQNIEEEERLEKAIVKAKPKSLWARFKEGAGKLQENVKEFFTGVSKERAAKKAAKAKGKKEVKEAKRRASAYMNNATDTERQEKTDELYNAKKEDFNKYVKVAPEELTPPPGRSEETAEEKKLSLREQLAEKYKDEIFTLSPEAYKIIIDTDMSELGASSIEELYNLLPEIEDKYEQARIGRFIAGYYATHPEQEKDGQSQGDDHEGPEQ